MECRLDNDIVFINKRKLRLIAYGKTGVIYKLNKQEAIKIFYPNKCTMDVATARVLQSIPTTRIIVPNHLVLALYEDILKGITFNLKKPKPSEISNMPKSLLVENITHLENDTETLSENKVLLNNLTPDNTLFSKNSLYISDSAGYTILKLFSSEELEKLNKFQLDTLIEKMVIGEMKESNMSKRDISKAKDLFRLKDENQDMSDLFDEVLPNDYSIKQFIKTIEL